ncbi:unnamed protein product, partial [Protopolystoma xenopodis]
MTKSWVSRDTGGSRLLDRSSLWPLDCTVRAAFFRPALPFLFIRPRSRLFFVGLGGLLGAQSSLVNAGVTPSVEWITLLPKGLAYCISLYSYLWSLSRAVCCLWPAKDVWLAKTGLDSYKRTGYDQFNEHKRQQLSDASEEAVSDLRMQLPVSWCESVPFNERTSHLVCQTVWQEFSIHLTPLSWPPKAGDLRIATETEVGTSISCLQTLRSLTITGTDISSHLRQDANKGSSSDDFEVQAISDLEASDNLVRLTSRELRLALFPLSGQLELQALTVQSTRLQYVEPGFIDQLEAPQLRDIQLRQNRFLTTDGLGTGWLGGLRGLQLLDLSQNRLEAIHLARWGLPSDPISPVIRLDLSDNRI